MPHGVTFRNDTAGHLIHYYCQKPGALYPAANATINVRTYFCLVRQKTGGQIQAARFTGGR